MYAAKNSYGFTHLFLRKPVRVVIQPENIILWRDPCNKSLNPYHLDASQFPNLQPEDEPIEVELQIKDNYTQNVCQKAINKYGPEHQKDKTIEECSELIQALVKERHHRQTDVITEIADVQIMLDQLKIIYGTELIQGEINRKLKRLDNSIK